MHVKCWQLRELIQVWLYINASIWRLLGCSLDLMPLSAHTLPLLWAQYGVWWNHTRVMPVDEHYPQISNVFYRAARSPMFPAACCGLKYLTSSRDLAAIWDISLLIPADWYKQMLNVRLNEDRISVWTIMFSRSDGVGFHIACSFGDKAGLRGWTCCPGSRHNIYCIMGLTVMNRP